MPFSLKSLKNMQYIESNNLQIEVSLNVTKENITFARQVLWSWEKESKPSVNSVLQDIKISHLTFSSDQCKATYNRFHSFIIYSTEMTPKYRSNV